MDMYKAIDYENEFIGKMTWLAKNFLQDIVDLRIERGDMEETEDGRYSIRCDGYSGKLEVDIQDGSKLMVEAIYLDKEIYLGMDNGEEYYLRSLPIHSIVDVCVALEDYLDEEEAE